MTARIPTHRKHPRGFTLVELLVVIGIIALLISILLPSLNRARQSANATVCLSNMRQMGQGVNLYANDNDQSHPWGIGPDVNNGEDNTPYQPRWFETISEYVGELEQSETYEYDPNSQSERTPTHPIFADTDTLSAGNLPGPDGTGINHYSANIRVFGDRFAGDRFRTPTPPFTYPPPKKLGSVRDSANTAAVWDSHQLYYLRPRESTHEIYRGSAQATSRHFDPGYDIGGLANHGAFYAPGYYGIRGLVEYSPVDDDYEGELVNNYYEGDIAEPRDGSLDIRLHPGIRARHMDNKRANILFADGHAVGMRESEMTRRQFAVTE